MKKILGLFIFTIFLMPVALAWIPDPGFETVSFGIIDTGYNFYNVEGNSYQYLECAYDVPLTGQLRQVQIGTLSFKVTGISPQLLSDANKTQIWLYVNGQNFSTADDYYVFDTEVVGPVTYESGYFLWNISLNITADQLVFEVKTIIHDFCVILAYGGYSQLTATDLSEDGSIRFYLHNTAAQFGDGTVNGYTKLGGSPYNENAVRFFIDLDLSALSGGPSNLNGNWLDVQGALRTHQPVFISYAVSTLADATYIYISDDAGATNLTDQNLPYKIPVYQGTFIYIPQTADTYTVMLVRGGDTISSTNFVVTKIPDRSWVEVKPAIGSKVSVVNVRHYYAASEEDGVIAVFDQEKLTDNLIYAIDTVCDIHHVTGIQGNTTYNIIDHDFPEGKVYFRLFANTSQPEALGPAFPFTIFSIKENNVSVKWPTIWLNYGEALMTTQTIYYSHNYVNGKVGIFIKNNLISEVGKAKTGSVDYKCTKAGTFDITLKVYLNGAWRTMNTASFNVSTSTPSGLPEQPLLPEVDYKGIMGETWAAILGLIIVIICLLIPLLIDFWADISSHLPALVYVLLGAVGVAIAIVLGLWPLWVTFFLLAVAVIYMIYTYVQGTGGMAQFGGKK